MWIEDVRIILPQTIVFGIRSLVFMLGAPKLLKEVTNARFFGYKSLIYEPNLAKFLTNVGTIAVHKSCEIQKYRLRESPLQGAKVAKK